MLNEKIKKIILDIAQEQSLNIHEVNDRDALVEDIGFASLDIATLVSHLESDMNINPFVNNLALITDVRTVGDLCRVYEHALSGKVDENKIISTEDADRGANRRKAAKRRSND